MSKCNQLVLETLRSLTFMPKILPNNDNPICKTSKLRLIGPIIWCHINPHAKRIHCFHIVADGYDEYIFCILELTIPLKKHTWEAIINIRDVNRM